MFNFLKSVIGGKKSDNGGEGNVPGPDKETARDIEQDLKRLETLDPNLAKRAISYALTGDNGSVLLELEQRSTEAVVALAPSVYNATPAVKQATEAAAKARKTVLSRRHDAHAIWIRRYLEILAAPQKGARWGIFAHAGPSPLWLRAFFNDSNGYALNHTRTPAEFVAALSWREPNESAAVFALDMWILKKSNQYYFREQDIAPLFDFKTELVHEREAILAAFANYDRPAQANVIEALKQFDLVRGEYFDFIYQQYLQSPSKAVRESARNALLASPPDALAASATQTLADGNPTARAQAAQLLPLVLGEQARPLLEAHLAKETAKSVRKVIELGLGSSVVVGDDESTPAARTLTEDGVAGYLAADGTEVLTPAPADLPKATPLPESIVAGYRKLLEQQQARSVAHYESLKQRYAEATAEQKTKFWKSGAPTPPKPMDYSLAARYCAFLAAESSVTKQQSADFSVTNVFAPYGTAAAAQTPFNDPGMTLWHLARAQALQAIGFRANNPTWSPSMIVNGGYAITAAMHARLVDGFDFRTLAGLMSSALDANELAICILRGGMSHDLAPEAIWPYLTGHFDVLDQAIGQAASTYFRDPPVERALERLRLFPKLPARYFNTVLTHALSPKKSLNKPARALLLELEGIEKRLLPFLSDGKQDVRVGVAQMLGQIGAKSTIDPLKERLAKEKSDLVRAALLRSLRQLGVDISSYVTPAILVKEAAAGLKGNKAKDVAWLTLDALPALKWADGNAVPAEVPRWWIALAAKLSQPGGNDLFALWLDQLAPASAEAFGRSLLDAFLRYDSTRCSEEEANAHAKAHAQQRYDQFQEYAKRWNSEYYRSYTYEKAFADLRAERLSIYPNNAYADRGILGLATRAEGTHVVQVVRAYMRDHYTRTSQVKALTDYLGGNPAPACLQMLLSIARRHRTNAVQVLAGELIDRISEDRGWTAEELADRTIPSAGLDERGILDLEIGSRTYQARLDAEDVLTLYNPDGKIVQNLPQVKDGPDKESAALAKKALANAKKELKQVHEFQAKRLYEALCVSRRWPIADWQQYLLEHPIAGRLVQRLVWLGLNENGESIKSFRPLEDLTLSDNADEMVDPAEFVTVQLAHSSLLPAEQSATWRTHLDDYKITPLFDQFDRPLLAERTGTAIGDRVGHMLEAFKLRSATQKLGYERAGAEDGGWFTQYLKPFASIGITAVIEFTGSPLPEENREVALVEAKFIRSSKGRRSAYGREMPLKDVPPVLLSEVWNDFHQIAKAGTGFSEDWRKKVAW